MPSSKTNSRNRGDRAGGRGDDSPADRILVNVDGTATTAAATIRGSVASSGNGRRAGGGQQETGTRPMGSTRQRQQGRGGITLAAHPAEQRIAASQAKASKANQRRSKAPATSSAASDRAPKQDGDGRGAGSETARTASRREYTLFDHLFAGNSASRSRVERALGPVAPHDRAAKGPEPRTRNCIRAGKVSSRPTVARPQPVPGEAAPAQEAVAETHSGAHIRVWNGIGAGASFGGRRNAEPADGRGNFVAKQARGKNDRAINVNSAWTRKVGKQRIGPRKKNLSSLKKRILLDRAAKWAQQEPPPAECPPTSEPTLALDCTPGVVVACGGGRGGGSGVTGGQEWVVVIHNLLDEEDVEDDDDYAEVERDVREMASAFGDVLVVEVPRKAPQSGVGAAAAPVAKVFFATPGEAERARKGFHGRVVGGKALEVDVKGASVTEEEHLHHRQYELTSGKSLTAKFGGLEQRVVGEEVASVHPSLSSGSAHGRHVLAAQGLRAEKCDADMSRNPCPRHWRVVVRNLVDEEDDLQDDEEYAQVCSDAAEIVGMHGHIVAFDIPRRNVQDDGCKIGEVIVTLSSQAEAEACVQGIRGRRIGGKELEAEVSVPRAVPIGSSAPQGGGMDTNVDGDATAVVEWRVVVRNFIDPEDLEDDDNYSEVRADFTAMASAYGHVSTVHIPRDESEGHGARGADPGEAVAVFGSVKEAEACARGLRARVVSGKRLEAAVLSASGNQEQAAGNGASSPSGGPSGEGGAVVLAPGNELPMDAAHSGDSVVCANPRVGGGGGTTDTPQEQDGGGRMNAGRASGLSAPKSHAPAPHLADQGKRIPDKYKEAAALPKPPQPSGGVPRTYLSQVKQLMVLLYSHKSH